MKLPESYPKIKQFFLPIFHHKFTKVTFYHPPQNQPRPLNYRKFTIAIETISKGVKVVPFHFDGMFSLRSLKNGRFLIDERNAKKYPLSAAEQTDKKCKVNRGENERELRGG